MTTSSITLTPRELRTLLNKVMPFASRDTLLPSFTAVTLTARNDSIIAVATDRYRVGIAKIPTEDRPKHPFEASISLADCRILLRSYPVPRKNDDEKPVIFTIKGDGKTMVVTQPGAETAIQISVTLVNTGTFDIRSLDRLVTRAMAADAVPFANAFNASLLASFSHLGASLRIKNTGPSKPVLITADDFIGCIMPLRLNDLLIAGETEWSGMLDQDEAAAVEDQAKAS